MAAVAALLVLISGTPDGTGERGDDTVHALWRTLDARWNARDASGFSALYSKDASFFVRSIDGDLALEGRAAIETSFAQRFPGFGPAVQHRTTLREIRPISADLIAVDGSVEILRVGDTTGVAPGLVRRFVLFAVLVRRLRSEERPEAWEIHTLRAYQADGA